MRVCVFFFFFVKCASARVHILSSDDDRPRRAPWQSPQSTYPEALNERTFISNCIFRSNQSLTLFCNINL